MDRIKVFRPITLDDNKYMIVGHMFKLLDYHKNSYRIWVKYAKLCWITSEDEIIKRWKQHRYPNLTYVMDCKKFFLKGIWISKERILIQDYDKSQLPFELLTENDKLIHASESLNELEDFF